MEVAGGEEARESRTRSRGLLAGRLAVKIEICTDSSMRGGGRVWRGREEGEPESVRVRRLENQICHASSSTSLAPRLLRLSSKFFLPPRLPCILFLLYLLLSFSLFLSLFAGRYKMSYSYEGHITREKERERDQKRIYETELRVCHIFPTC